LAFVSTHNKSFGVNADCFDVKSVKWLVLVEQKFEISVCFTKNNVALVGAYKEFSFWKPAMCCVITAYVLFFFVQRGKHGF
jgi:hypothetical protein